MPVPFESALEVRATAEHSSIPVDKDGFNFASSLARSFKEQVLTAGLASSLRRKIFS